MRLERMFIDQVAALRFGVLQLRIKTDDVASREALLEERNGRELGEEALRQLSAKLEETIENKRKINHATA